MGFITLKIVKTIMAQVIAHLISAVPGTVAAQEVQTIPAPADQAVVPGVGETKDEKQ